MNNNTALAYGRLSHGRLTIQLLTLKCSINRERDLVTAGVKNHLRSLPEDTYDRLVIDLASSGPGGGFPNGWEIAWYLDDN